MYDEFAFLLQQIHLKNTQRDEIEKELSTAVSKEKRRTKDLKYTLAELKKSEQAGLNLPEDLTNEINERKKTEKALRKSEEQVRTFFSNVLDLIYFKDINSNTYFFNNVMLKVSGYAKSDFEGNDNFWYSIIHPNDKIKFRHPEFVNAKKLKSLTTKYRIVSKNKSIRWLESTIVKKNHRYGRIGRV